MSDPESGRTTTLANVGSPAIVALPQRLGAWSCQDVVLEGESSLRTRFRADGTSDWIEVVVTQGEPAAGVRVFERFVRSFVRYRGQIGTPSDEAKAAVRAIVLGVGTAIEARLAVEPPGTTLAAALGRRDRGGSMVFSRASLEALLAPDVVRGAPVAGGWSLADVFPTSYLRVGARKKLELVLDFTRDDGRRVLFVVSPRSEGQPGFLSTAHFSLSHLSLAGAPPAGLDSLRALLGFLLQLRDDPSMEVVFPDVAADVELDLVLGPGAEPTNALVVDEGHRSLNLAIQSDCGQSCAFCSIKETAPPEDGGREVLARLVADLRASRARGVRQLRLNGYDPLTYSRVLDVLRTARELGYDHVDVFSPCTVLADPAVADAVLAELPASRIFHVPVYSTDPAIHDRVVGRPGAHALVLRAIENLVARSGPDTIAILSVVTGENHAGMPALAAWATELGLRFSAHLPYPSFESRADRFFRATPRQTAVVESFVPTYLASDEEMTLPVVGLAPCVSLRVLAAAGVPVRRWLRAEAEVILPGAEYRDEKFRHGAGEKHDAAFAASMVRCPHVDKCLLRDACSKELLRGYVELHGKDEFRAVELAELIAAT